MTPPPFPAPIAVMASPPCVIPPVPTLVIVILPPSLKAELALMAPPVPLTCPPGRFPAKNGRTLFVDKVMSPPGAPAKAELVFTAPVIVRLRPAWMSIIPPFPPVVATLPLMTIDMSRVSPLLTTWKGSVWPVPKTNSEALIIMRGFPPKPAVFRAGCAVATRMPPPVRLPTVPIALSDPSVIELGELTLFGFASAYIVMLPAGPAPPMD